MVLFHLADFAGLDCFLFLSFLLNCFSFFNDAAERNSYLAFYVLFKTHLN